MFNGSLRRFFVLFRILFNQHSHNLRNVFMLMSLLNSYITFRIFLPWLVLLFFLVSFTFPNSLLFALTEIIPLSRLRLSYLSSCIWLETLQPLDTSIPFFLYSILHQPEVYLERFYDVIDSTWMKFFNFRP